MTTDQGTDEDADLAAVAARDNAAWCRAVCGAHGSPGEVSAHAWTSARPTPPLSPDAVPLSRGLPAAALLDRVDSGPGCSVKDSFADLDLSGHGFHVLFQASWNIKPTRPSLPRR